jgi:hypothetical protein
VPDNWTFEIDNMPMYFTARSIWHHKFYVRQVLCLKRLSEALQYWRPMTPGLEVQIGVEFAIRQHAHRWGIEQPIDPTDTLGE